MDIEYVDILTGENLSIFKVANMDLLYWSVRSSKGFDVGIVFLASCEYHFIRVHENMIQHPSNNISIQQIWYVS